MKITIDQSFCVKHNLSITQCAILDCIKNLVGKVEKLTVGGNNYYFITRTLIVDKLPAFSLKKSTVYQYFRSLKEKGFIDWVTFEGKEYISFNLKVESCKKDELMSECRDVIDHFNGVTGRSIRTTDTVCTLIKSRLKDGYKVNDLKKVVDRKNREWKDNETMRKYIRPQTLFNKSKFEMYIEEQAELRIDEKEKVKELLGL